MNLSAHILTLEDKLKFAVKAIEEIQSLLGQEIQRSRMSGEALREHKISKAHGVSCRSLSAIRSLPTP